ncbi:MAG TPA: mechanosensitive ion channel family protein [Longimicrobiales bacterium]
MAGPRRLVQAAADTAAPANTIADTATAIGGAVRDAALPWLDRYPILTAILGLAALAGVSWIALRVVQRYLLRAVAAVARHSTTTWDEAIFDRAVFHRLAWGVPLLVVYYGVVLVPNLGFELSRVIQRVAVASLVLVAVRAFAALLAAINEIYNRHPMAKERPIKGFLQVASVIAHLVAVIFMVAALVDRSPLILFSGLGAMTAILLLVFRDSILSLVAGVQLTTNDLIRVGDWIEMPQFGADGDVIDIALNSVRVQNWDKTYTVIPTHKFLEHSFKNWRGMQDSGGRRIKRAFHIDMSTIRFLTDDEIERFRRFALLRDYIARKTEELAEYNRVHAPGPDDVANARRLTNIGTLRAYITAYLRQHPGIHQKLTFLVRHLEPTPEGLPIQIYVFANDVRWSNYEGIQADIFDHILAMVPEFGLRVYQKPSGADVAAAAAALGESARAMEPA